MSFQQVLRDVGTNLQVSFYSDEALVDPTGNAATVTITRADGTALATNAATTRLSQGVYQYPLADQANLDYLTVVWQGTFGGLVQTVTDYVEIVGGFYFALAELRAQKNLADTEKFTTAEMAVARRWFETKFEDFTGVAWVPRFRRVRLNGGNRATVMLPDTTVRVIRSVTVTVGATSTVYTAGELADLDFGVGMLTRRDGTWFAAGSGNVVVAYEHGHDVAPQDVKDAALVACRDRLLGDQTGNRVYAVQTEDGIVRTSTPGPDHPFGLPFADEVAMRRRELVVAVA